MLSTKFFSSLFLVFLACPYLGFLVLEQEFIAQEPELAEVTYEPDIMCWFYHPSVAYGMSPYENPSEVSTGTYLFSSEQFVS